MAFRDILEYTVLQMHKLVYVLFARRRCRILGALQLLPVVGPLIALLTMSAYDGLKVREW